MVRGLLVALLLALPAATAAQLPPRMPPTDHCAQDRSFAAFRRALLAAIARRDVAFLRRIAADDIDYSFGGDPRGWAGFARAWDLAHPARSPLWRELGAALRLGCARDEGNEFVVPSMSLIGDEHMDEDYTRYLVAVRPGAALHAGPAEASRVIAPLHWDVVGIGADPGRGPWIAATLADGRRGYVRRALFRGFLDARAIFVKRAGSWQMTAFVAGD
jgi:hypothetical protein